MNYTDIIIDAILQNNQEISFFMLDKSFQYLRYNDMHAKHVQLIWNTDITKVKSILDCYKDKKSMLEFKKKLDRVLTGESFTQIDTRIVPQVDHPLFFEVKWTPLIDNNQIEGILCISKDITETIIVKNELQRHQTIFEAFFKQGINGSLIVLLDEPVVWNDQIDQKEVLEFILEKHRVIRVNQAYLNQYGYREDEILNRTAKEIYHNDLTMIRSFWLTLLKDKQINREKKQHRLNGDEFWVKSEYHLFFDDYGRILGYFGSQQDITESKRHEVESLYANKRLQYIIENESTSIAIFDQNMKYLYVSKNFLKDYNKSDLNVIGKSHYEIFPNLLPEIKDVHQRALNGEIVVSNKSHMDLDDGTSQWLRWECRPWYENDNSIGGIILHSENISERIQMEDELKKREYSLRGMFEQAAVGMSYGPHKLLTNVNQKYCDIVGYTKEELAQLTYMDVTYPEDIEKDAKSFESLIKGELSTYTIEKRLVRKDKSIIWINLTVSLVPQAEGDFYVLAVIEDINERKNAELSMHFLNYHDQLTGCYNRRYYEEHVRQMDVSSLYPLSLVMIDADGLKLVNDALGHLYGDKLLVSVANTIVDVVENLGKVCRIGGDEFIITLPNTTYEQGVELIHKINNALLNVSVKDFKITVSSGCATKTNPSQSITDIFSQAEDTMYREKLVNSQMTIQKTLDQVLDVLFERSTFEKTHAQNVLNYCLKMADALHYSNAEKELLMKAAYIHDIGKIGLDVNIINKKGNLIKDELKEVKRHSEVGYRILNSSNHFSDISMIILAHHERWDGKGYPKGLKGKEIPEYARIISIAESYDVLISHDSYKEYMSKSDAFNELLQESGAQFDPELVIKFVETIGKAT